MSYPPDFNDEGESLYYLTRSGPRVQMSALQAPATGYQTLPPLSVLADQGLRPPPPQQLSPPAAPHSPQGRPYYSDPSTRGQPPSAYQQPYSQQPAHQANERWQGQAPLAPPPERASRGPPVTPSPLYPLRTTHRPSLPGTLHEVLSPSGYTPQGPSGRSVFDDSMYAANQYPPSGHQSHHSPAGSYGSSNTSSSGQASATAQHTGLSAPVGPPTIQRQGNVQDIPDRYRFYVRQQPVAARACGFGERDRRVIDPPPILQLTLSDFDPRSASDVAELQWPYYIVHCSLISVPLRSAATYTPPADVSSGPDPNQSNKVTRRLMGTLVASPFFTTDPEIPESIDESARKACFFVFPDLSCRQSGLYRLRFTLMKIPIDDVSEGGLGSIAGIVDSGVFEVFGAKDFPGMRASTLLTRELKNQGAAVSVKKGKGGGRGQKKGSSNSERSGSDGSDGTPAPRPIARPRRRL